MKIGQTKKIESVQAFNKGSETGPKKKPYQVRDDAEISPISKDMALVAGHLDDRDIDREKKVQELRKEIQDCRYEMNDKILDRIVVSLLLNLS